MAVDQLERHVLGLADPTRGRSWRGSRTARRPSTSWPQPFPVSLQAVSKHLKVLERAGPDHPREGRSVASVPVAGDASRGRHPLVGGLPAVLGAGFDRLDEHLRQIQSRDTRKEHDMSDDDTAGRRGLRAQRCRGDPDRAGLRRAPRAGLQGVDGARAVRDVVRRARIVDPARQGVDGCPAGRRVERHDAPRAGPDRDPVRRRRSWRSWSPSACR